MVQKEEIISLARQRKLLKPDEEISLFQFGDYIGIKKIGQGSYSDVFLVYEPKLNRFVALKLLKFFVQEDLERLRREAKILAKLEHPNILNIYSIGDQNGKPYITTKYIDGQSLDNKKLSQVEIVTLFIKIVSAIEYAHRSAILHRDLKPSNILLDKNREPYICDFGLAKDYQIRDSITPLGDILGTPAFMPPEQTEGKVIDERSDIYSIGATLYFVLTNRFPVEGNSIAEVVNNIITKTPSEPLKLNPGINSELNRICMKCLEKDKSRRYQSCADLLSDLKDISHPSPQGRKTFLKPIFFVPFLALLGTLIFLLFPKEPKFVDNFQYIQDLLYCETLAYDKTYERSRVKKNRPSKLSEFEQCIEDEKFTKAASLLKAEDVKSASIKSLLLAISDPEKALHFIKDTARLESKTEIYYCALIFAYLNQTNKSDIKKNPKLLEIRKDLSPIIENSNNKWLLNLYIQLNIELFKGMEDPTGSRPYYRDTLRYTERLVQIDSGFAEAFVHRTKLLLLSKDPNAATEADKNSAIALELNPNLKEFISKKNK